MKEEALESLAEYLEAEGLAEDVCVEETLERLVEQSDYSYNEIARGMFARWEISEAAVWL